MDLHDIALLLVGGVIALVSSALTTVLTTYLSYRLSRRTAFDEAVDRVNYLMGKNVVTLENASHAPDEFETWKAQSRIFEKLTKNASLADLRGMTGILEEMRAKYEKLEQRAWEIKQK